MLHGVFHPVGAGLGMAHGLLVGGAVAFLGWGVVLSAASLVTVAPVGTPAFVGAVLSQAAAYLWALAVGANAYRRA